MDFQTSLSINRSVDRTTCIDITTNAVFRSKKTDEFYTVGRIEDINRTLHIGINASSISEQPHTFALQYIKITLFEHIDS